MSQTSQFVRYLFVALLLLSVGRSVSAGQATTATEWKSGDESRTRLLTPLGVEDDGRTLWIGLEMELERGWHSYWKNPGDAGLAPAFTIVDSNLIAAVEVLYTPPKYYPAAGGLDANGYADYVIYPVKLTLAESAPGAGEMPLNLDLIYLICKDLCIPFGEEFRTTIDLGAANLANFTSGSRAEKLAGAIAQLPKAPADVDGLFLSESLVRDGDLYELRINYTAPEAFTEGPELFLDALPDLKVGRPVYIPGESERELLISVPLQTKVAGKQLDTLTVDYLLTHIALDSELVAVETVTHLRAVEGAVIAAQSGGSGGGAFGAEQPLLLILLLALAGGFILNIMPCVLPVLSIKLMSILEHSGESQRKIAGGMLASSAGIIVSFLALATAAVVARSAGEFVGWGIQFQNPYFVTFLAIIVTLFALNMWGLFEITLPTSVASGATRSASGGGHFLQGMFATLLATPCSAPFLGTAISFALSSPPALVFGVFSAVGVGMALPYLVIAIAPGSIRLLPKPGPWMEKAKVVFGFLLLGTALWLVTKTLSYQVDSGTLLYIEFVLLLMALTLWLKKSLAPFSQFFRSLAGWLAVGATAALTALALYLAGAAEPPANGVALVKSADGIQWEAFSESRVNEQLAQGDVVFVDVTAEWCITCKANENLFIETDLIRSQIRDNGIVPLKADWTTRNEEIGSFLKRYGRSGVPFYIVFYGGSPDNYLTLPVTFTEGMLSEILSEAVEKNGQFTLDAENADAPAGTFILE